MPMFLKPGNHYSHMLRLHDGRLLMTWTHRSNLIDDDGFGTGSRGLLSYDDGYTFDFNSDYIVIKAQDDASPLAVSSGCAPSAGGCGCGVGYGNTLQLHDGSLLSATSFDIGQTIDIALWQLPASTDDRSTVQHAPHPSLSTPTISWWVSNLNVGCDDPAGPCPAADALLDWLYS